MKDNERKFINPLLRYPESYKPGTPLGRLASLVGITERELEVGKLGLYKNFTGFDRKKNSYFGVMKEKRNRLLHMFIVIINMLIHAK